MSTSTGRAVSISRLLVVLLILLGLYITRDAWLPSGYRNAYPPSRATEQSTSPSEPPQDDTPPPQHCRDHPSASNVMLLLKTGATELYQKLPAHFPTTFKCVPHLMIFSDLAQSFADYPVYDAIAGVGAEFRDQHPDFALYRQLQQYRREGQDTSKLRGSGGWNLDKWKFFPMLNTAFESAEAQEVDWFVVMEADTSLSWTNLLQWLDTMDARKPWYLGAQNLIGDVTFAHGGSGIVISRKAAQLWMQARETEGKETWDARWDRRVSVSCCGDEVIAEAFATVNVHLTPAWPLIQGETVATLDWTAKHWCAVAISWHHVSPLELDALWQFESEWIAAHGWHTPYLYRDVFEEFIDPHITANRTKWNNLSKDRMLASADVVTTADDDFDSLSEREKNATTSLEACAEACARLPEKECVQWMYAPGRCYLGKDLRFGKADERDVDVWTSGWDQQKVARFKERLKGCRVKWAG